MSTEVEDENLLERKTKSTLTEESVQERSSQVLLKGFRHQVGGRASIYYYNHKTLCKPYVSRELYFYTNVPQQLHSFIPKFKGLVTVYLFHGEDMQLRAYALPDTLLEPNSPKLKSFAETPKTHSKRCIKKMDQLQTTARSEPALCIQVATMDIKDDQNTNLKMKDDQDTTSPEAPAIEADNRDTEMRDHEVCSRSSSNEEKKLWSDKVMLDAWSKSMPGSCESLSKGKPIKKQFMLIENMLSKYHQPCVLDIKVGTCIRSNLKLMKLDRRSTRVQLGLRLSGMQLYDGESDCYSYLNKYDGEKLDVDQLKQILLRYFNNAQQVRKRREASYDVTESREASDPITRACASLSKLRSALRSLSNRRFYSCSVLLSHEGAAEQWRAGRVGVKLIDFAHYCLDDRDLHPGLDRGLLFGVDNLIAIVDGFK